MRTSAEKRRVRMHLRRLLQHQEVTSPFTGISVGNAKTRSSVPARPSSRMQRVESTHCKFSQNCEHHTVARRKEGKPSLHKHTMPDIKTFDGNWPSQLNSKRACGSRSFFFFSLTTTLSFLSKTIHGERKAFLAVTKALLAAADQLPRPIHFLA